VEAATCSTLPEWPCIAGQSSRNNLLISETRTGIGLRAIHLYLCTESNRCPACDCEFLARVGFRNRSIALKSSMPCFSFSLRSRQSWVSGSMRSFRFNRAETRTSSANSSKEGNFITHSLRGRKLRTIRFQFAITPARPSPRDCAPASSDRGRRRRTF
jgi:hypothetical protein